MPTNVRLSPFILSQILALSGKPIKWQKLTKTKDMVCNLNLLFKYKLKPAALADGQKLDKADQCAATSIDFVRTYV